MSSKSITWVVGSLFLGFVVAVLAPVFASAKAASIKSSCFSSMRDMGRAMNSYQADFDDRLMNASKWGDQVGPYVPNPNVMACSCMKLSGVNFSYAMEFSLSEVSGSELPHPERQGVLFDSKVMVPNASGGMSLLPNPPRHHRANHVAYADGHARYIRKQVRPDGSEGEWIGRW
jgi:hypothetical protein